MEENPPVKKRPTIFKFGTSEECYCLGSQLANYLGLRGQLYSSYPGLYRRLATEEERAALGRMGIYVKVVPYLLKANEVEDVIEGRTEQYKRSFRPFRPHSRFKRQYRLGGSRKKIVKKKVSLEKTGKILGGTISKSAVKAQIRHRPPFSIHNLVAQALLHSETGCLRSFEILHHISKNYPYYKTQNVWKKSVYSILSTSPHFSKVTSDSEKNKTYWTINDYYKEELANTAFLPLAKKCGESLPVEDPVPEVSILNDDIIFVDSNLLDEEEPVEIATKTRSAVRSERPVWCKMELDSCRTVVSNQARPAPDMLAMNTAIESIAKQEGRYKEQTIVDYVDLADDEETVDVKHELLPAVDLTYENLNVKTNELSAICPICTNSFASNEELGAHVRTHSWAPPSSVPNVPVHDDRNVMLRQTLDNLSTTFFPGDQKAICIFTGNNMYFRGPDGK